MKDNSAMKVVILAGGFGSRLLEETERIPKPMVEVGGRPILWHIMKIYAHHGFNDFVICLGYKGYVIKEYFANYFLHNSDVTIDVGSNQVEAHSGPADGWKVTLADTGLETGTGGRLKKVAKYLGGRTFLMTYGDGVSDVDLKKLVAFHRRHGKLATVTAVRPWQRFGVLEVSGSRVKRFAEKPEGGGGWINGGFFVLEPQALSYIDSEAAMFERKPLERLAGRGELMTFKHPGFWQSMDKLHDKQKLDELWKRGQAPWKVWPA